MLSRRDFYRYGSFVLGGTLSLGLAIPGMAYLLDPLRRKAGSGTTQAVTRLSTLKVGVPESFAIIDEKRDAWVKYPREPVGTVWLVRQPEGKTPPVLAFTGECPHLGCAISRGDDGKSFVCRCHGAAYDHAGERSNQVSPRSMDSLEVELTEGDDPSVVVHFRRFRHQVKEKTPLV
jgi:menaquinol-cytochrome c reductase iron-sulfur subunit